MSSFSTRTLAIVAAIVALALPASAAARGGGHPRGGGGHPSGGSFHPGGGSFHPSGPMHFSAPISRAPTFTRSFTRNIYRGSIYHGNRSISGPRYSRYNRLGRINRVTRLNNLNRLHNTNLTRTNFAARSLRANTHLGTSAIVSRAGLARARAWNWHSRGDWWRHRRFFFFGWAGPLFWPYFYDDLWYDVFWNYGPDYYYDPFWAYGYGDIYGAMFSPYGFDDLAGWAPPPLNTASIERPRPGQPPPASSAPPAQWSAMCGSDTEVVALPIDKISAAVSPNDQQRAALDALANASVKAAQLIKAACPSDVAYTPTGRLDAMQHRVEAMVQAVALVRDPLDKFYAALSDEQKARLNAVNHGDANPARATTSACGPNAVAIPTWPQARIEQAVRPSEGQRVLLDKLKDANAKAAEMLKAACPNATPATPPARLAAVAKRLDALLDAVKLVHAALNDFYGSLTDEQKAQFNGIPPTVRNGAAHG